MLWWILAVVGFCFLLVAIGLLGAVIWVGADDAEWRRRHRRWEEEGRQP